jgi:hypothetical protein
MDRLEDLLVICSNLLLARVWELTWQLLVKCIKIEGRGLV